MKKNLLPLKFMLVRKDIKMDWYFLWIVMLVHIERYSFIFWLDTPVFKLYHSTLGQKSSVVERRVWNWKVPSSNPLHFRSIFWELNSRCNPYLMVTSFPINKTWTFSSSINFMKSKGYVLVGWLAWSMGKGLGTGFQYSPFTIWSWIWCWHHVCLWNGEMGSLRKCF